MTDQFYSPLPEHQSHEDRKHPTHHLGILNTQHSVRHGEDSQKIPSEPANEGRMWVGGVRAYRKVFWFEETGVDSKCMCGCPNAEFSEMRDADKG